MREIRALDTYVGREVVKIDTSTKEWFVELVGGIRIINKDNNMPAPDFPVTPGLTFTNVLMDAKSTQMVLFTRSTSTVYSDEYRVSFNPLEYQIYDADSGSAWYPQAGGYRAFMPDEAATVTPETPQQEATKKNTKIAKKKQSSKKTKKTND